MLFLRPPQLKFLRTSGVIGEKVKETTPIKQLSPNGQRFLQNLQKQRPSDQLSLENSPAVTNE